MWYSDADNLEDTGSQSKPCTCDPPEQETTKTKTKRSKAEATAKPRDTVNVCVVYEYLLSIEFVCSSLSV